MRKQTEYSMHVTFWDWCCLKKDVGKYMFAIEHGEKRNPITGARLKRKGVKPGMADYFFMRPNRLYHGLWLEFKCGKNIQSQSQKEFEKIVIECGDNYVVCYSVEEAIRQVTLHLSDM